MKSLRVSMLIALGCVTFAGSTFTQEKDPAEEGLKKLQGWWMFEKSEQNGAGTWSLAEETIYIERNVVQHVKKDGTLIFNGSRAEITIDPTKKPMTIDIVRKNGAPGQKVFGIYKLEGDRLIIATNTNNPSARPAQFTTKLTAGAGKATNLQTYKLVAGEAAKKPKAKENKKLTQDQLDVAIAAEMKKLQGHWIFEKSERNGFSYWTLPEEAIYIENNVLQHVKKDGTLIFNGSRSEISIDPSVSPSSIDLVRKNGAPGQKILGIYKIEGERLIIALNTADDNKELRPGQFTTKLTAKLERAAIVQTYKRAPK